MLKQAAVSFSMATRDPASYWLSQPLTELLDWVEVIKERQPKGR
ncbi:hypothetical protein [Brevibacillus reuszeri]|nr:hypothetical protein [Brevibacillus reuszeri]